jgi:outer membrane biosynthesis protein TonB
VAARARAGQQESMSSSDTPENNIQPTEAEPRPLAADGSAQQDQTPPPPPPASVPVFGSGGSRWVDYDSHELLEMISQMEDERRWARLREGVLWAVLFHMALLIALFLLPKYVFKAPPVVEKGLHDKDEFTYMDTPTWKPKTPPKPLKPIEQPQIDKQTLDQIRKQAPPQPQPVPQQQPAPAPQQQAVAPSPVPPQPQGQQEAPRPSAVPKPNFAMGSSNPMDSLRDAMRGAARNRTQGGGGDMGAGSLRMHPGAGSGGVEVLSDTQGVDFSSWIHAWHYETEKTWDPLIPDEVNAPIYKSGMVAIRFKVLPNGRLMDGSVVLEGRSGDVALDRAAWGALTGSNYPSLPRDFHGPYLELRAFFLYNMKQK